MLTYFLPFLIYPLFVYLVFAEVHPLSWKVVLLICFIASLFFPPANVVFPVVAIIAIPVIKKVSEINRRL